MTADVQEIESQVLVVEPLVTERVAAELHGGDEMPVDADGALCEGGRQERVNMLGRVGDF